MPNSELKLDLVYNPSGAFLPGDQKALEADFKKALATNFDIQFHNLFSITNLELWKTNITALSKFENVHCKLSGMVTETKDFCFTKEDFTPFIDHVFSCFGANRILFGSDWPVCLLAADYTKVITLILEYLNEYSAHIKSQVLGINAIKIYNL